MGGQQHQAEIEKDKAQENNNAAAETTTENVATETTTENSEVKAEATEEAKAETTDNTQG